MTDSPPPTSPIPLCLDCYKEVPGNKDMYPTCYECYHEKPYVRWLIHKLTFEEMIKNRID